jgi:mannose-6-phosphate isomerase-like protein (cupin superfamily)
MHETIVNPIIKDEVSFIQTAASTNGRISTLQVKLMPGGGTPLHFHKNFSETFIVCEGVLTLTLKDKVIHLRVGDKFEVQKMQWHRFSNEHLFPVHFTTLIQPGSEGFENALRILYGLAAENKTDFKGIPNNPLALAVVANISDMQVEGPRFLISPLFALLNMLAITTGYKRSLLRKFC